MSARSNAVSAPSIAMPPLSDAMCGLPVACAAPAGASTGLRGSRAGPSCGTLRLHRTFVTLVGAHSRLLGALAGTSTTSLALHEPFARRSSVWIAQPAEPAAPASALPGRFGAHGTLSSMQPDSPGVLVTMHGLRAE